MCNEKQLKDWEELGFGKIKRVEYKKLPIDTRYFDEEFKFEMLEKISEKHDLDDILDGLKYKGKVQKIYIDPPFNKEQDVD